MNRKQPMPNPSYSDAGMRRRDVFIQEYGLGTVVAAEMAAVLDIFIKLGLITEGEYLDMVGYRCQQIDLKRQQFAEMQLRRPS